MSKHLHIVCLDAPSPPSYGGAIDMFCKIQALAAVGYKIHLHYFSYKTSRSVNGLEPYCFAIHAYRRKTFWRALSGTLPYIVSSRINQILIARLNGDDHPILFEGFHCSGLIAHVRAGQRKVLIRAHNDEAGYYASLAKVERNWWRKLYFERESRLLDKFQSNLENTLDIAAIAQNDIRILASRYGFKKLHLVPPFTPWQQIESRPGRGSYCLYHGNLAVPENEVVAYWLITKVFSSTNVPFVIAGNGGSKQLLKVISMYPHVKFVDHPSDEALCALIQDAHIHVLPSFNATGVKVKLLHALFNGRFCLTNAAGAAGIIPLESISIADTSEAFIDTVSRLMETSYTAEDCARRERLLQLFNNESNAQKLSALL